VLLGLAALWFASRIPRTLTVFVIAAFIAFGVAPIVGYLERYVARPFAIAIVYLGLVVTVIVLAFLVVPATLGQIQVIGSDLPAYIDAVQNWIDGAQKFLGDHFGKTYLPPGYGDLRGFIGSRISIAAGSTLASFTDILIGTFTAAIIGVSALVLSSFFLVRGESVADSLYAIVPAHRRETAQALGRELAHVFGSYVSGQAALCTITGAFIFVGTLAAGFKFALLLGIVAGLAYAVPFVGMIAAHVLALVLAAPQGAQTVIWVQVIVFTMARISDNLLVPKIMSESVGVSPIVVMFAVFAGGELFGLPGLLLGIPAAALAKVAWRFFRARSSPADVVPLPTGEVIPTPSESADIGPIAAVG
jgi:predicted PurR-regulated permease PerM